MTKPVEPLSEFNALRRAGISHIEHTSGKIWTDYNVHDPGITLLEQTCFALSQIAYQAQLPTRDLLTNERNYFYFHDLALFRPRKVLATNPVTRDDLVAWLSACKGIDSVYIAPPDDQYPGLYDVTIVPSRSPSEPPPDLATVQEAFAQVRPLCTDLRRIRLAEKIDIALVGEIEIGIEVLPETTAAALYHSISEILTGAVRDSEPATRQDVWEAPQRLLPPSSNADSASLDLGSSLAKLKKLPGIREIVTLTTHPMETREKDESTAVYHHIELPQTEDDIGLKLTLNGAPVALSAARIREEFIRISAETIAESSHHIEHLDWDVLKPGRRRHFTHAHVDSLLPQIYTAEGYGKNNSAAPIEVYRKAIDEVLRDMVGTLNALPEKFTADPKGHKDDAVLHRRRIDLLDYLIALQGAQMPPTRHSGLHKYRTVRARHRFEIDWRLEYLFGLPAIHAARATGPSGSAPGGFLAEFAVLCDLGVSEDGQFSAPLAAYGLTPDDGPILAEDPDAEDFTLISAHNVFDMIVPERDDAPLLSRDELQALSPFLANGSISTSLLVRLTDTDSFAICPAAGGAWLILLDPGSGHALRKIGVADTKQDAQDKVVRLRATWRHLNNACEAAHLTEQILLRNTDVGTPNVADLVLPGWTARCRMESFRSYVEAVVQALAPAHIHMRVHWLSYRQMMTYEKVKSSGTEDNDGDRSPLVAHLNALAEEAVA